MPVPTASATNPAIRMSEMRFEIVIVKRSLDAANAITAGKTSNRAMSSSNVVMIRLVHPSARGRRPPGGGDVPRRDRARHYDATLQRRVNNPSHPTNSATAVAAAPSPKEAAPRSRRGRSKPNARRLLAGVAELARHVRERVLELAAEGIHGRDDRDRDAGRDEAVFDRGCAALVTQKTLEHRHF